MQMHFSLPSPVRPVYRRAAAAAPSLLYVCLCVSFVSLFHILKSTQNFWCASSAANAGSEQQSSKTANYEQQTRPCFMYNPRRLLHARSFMVSVCISVRACVHEVQKRKQNEARCKTLKTNARERETDIRKRNERQLRFVRMAHCVRVCECASVQVFFFFFCVLVLVSEHSCCHCCSTQREREVRRR